MPVGDSIRALGWKAQTAIGTAATVTVAANWVEMFEWNPNIGTRVPTYQTGRRIQTTRVLRTTRHDTFTIRQANLDIYEFLVLLQSCMGPPASGVYKFGTALNSTPTAFLTFKFYYGQNESWLLQDCRVNTLEITGDAANGTVAYTAGILGLRPSGQPAAIWAPTLSVPAGNEPFDPWQVVLLKGGSSPGCVINWKVTLNNNFNPLYCFPVTNPTTSTEPGLPPSRYTDGNPTATVAITLDYTGYSGSSFADFLSHTIGPWSIVMTDPAGPGSLTWDLPQLDWTAGNLDGSNPDTRFTGTATLLLDATDATTIQATAVVPS